MNSAAFVEQRKRPKGKRRELALLEPIDAIDGPKMQALPTDRHRAFVRALYEVKPGFGFGVKAAKLSGWGCENSSAQSMATIASRLMHDERVLEAIHEEDRKRIRASAPRAIRSLQSLLEDSTHREHGRAIGMVLDRVHPAETTHMVKVQHEAGPALRATADVLARIAQLAASVGLDVAKMPPLIDVTPTRKAEPAT